MKKLYQVWETVPKKEKQLRGGLIILSLDEETRDEVLESVPIENIQVENGAQNVIDALNTVFEKDGSLSRFEVYENFATYTRPLDCNTADHCHEFNRRYQRVKASGTTM